MIKITILSNGIDIAGIYFPNNSLSFEIFNSSTINIYLVLNKKKIFSSHYLDFLNSSNQQYISPQAVIDNLLLNNNQPSGGGGGGSASSVTFTPNGDIGSTNVQNALVEVRDDTDFKLTAKQNYLGFTPEDSANKSTNVNTDQASNVKYPSVKAVYDWAVGFFQPILTAVNFGSFMSGLTTKSTLVGSDKISIVDSAAGNTSKTISYTDLTSALFPAQAKNTFYRGPVIGANASPSFGALNDLDLPSKSKVKYPLYGEVQAFGDSYTNGLGASPLTESYINKLAATNKVTITNNAVGGTGAWSACKTHFNAISTNGAVSPSIWMSGFNDLCRSGNVASAYLKIKGCLRSAIVNQYILFSSAASAVTNTGSWSNITGIGDKSANGLGANARQSSTSGNTLTYTSPISSNVIVGTFNTDGTSYDYGRFTVSIDGTVVQTFNPNGRTDGISDGVYDNGRTPEVLVFDGLGNFAHTVVITLLDSKTTVVDYFGVMDAPYFGAPMFVSSIPKRTASGYLLTPANGSDAILDLGDVAIQEVIAEFSNRPVVYVQLNNYYDPNTGVSGDNLHPSNFGYTRIFMAFQEHIRDAFFPRVIKIAAVNNTSANGIIASSNNILRFGINSNFSGVADNTSQAIAQMNLVSGNNDSNFQFFTSAANNTQTLALKITKDGDLEARRTAVNLLALGIASTNTAYFGVNADIAGMSINRNTSTGTFANTGKAAASLYLRGVSGAGTIEFYTSGTNNTLPTMAASFNSSGSLFIGGNTSATARLHLAAGTATAGTAPVKTGAGVVLTTPENGAIETDANNDIFQTNLGGVRGKVDVVRALSSSAATLTMTYTNSVFVFTGTISTWTLPAIAPGSNIIALGAMIRIKNKGTGIITLNSSGGANDIYDTAAVNTLTIASGDGVILIHDGTHFSKF